MMRVQLNLEIVGDGRRLFLRRYVELPFAPFKGLMIDSEEVESVWWCSGDDEYSGTRCHMVAVEHPDPEEFFEEAYADEGEWVKCDCIYQPLAQQEATQS